MVTRFFWPPEMPRARCDPTSVSAQICGRKQHGSIIEQQSDSKNLLCKQQRK